MSPYHGVDERAKTGIAGEFQCHQLVDIWNAGRQHRARKLKNQRLVWFAEIQQKRSRGIVQAYVPGTQRRLAAVVGYRDTAAPYKAKLQIVTWRLTNIVRGSRIRHCRRTDVDKLPGAKCMNRDTGIGVAFDR
nr:hypothetical protein [Paraburkholderia sp. BL25I1N1]